MIRRLERLSRPRLRFLFAHRLRNAVFGTLVVGLSVAAFAAPPFTGLDNQRPQQPALTLLSWRAGERHVR
jgi:hypothetical protein